MGYKQIVKADGELTRSMKREFTDYNVVDLWVLFILIFILLFVLAPYIIGAIF